MIQKEDEIYIIWYAKILTPLYTKPQSRAEKQERNAE